MLTSLLRDEPASPAGPSSSNETSLNTRHKQTILFFIQNYYHYLINLISFMQERRE